MHNSQRYFLLACDIWDLEVGLFFFFFSSPELKAHEFKIVQMKDNSIVHGEINSKSGYFFKELAG
jgi:hypothetical protein